jgi:hypothetical protein
MVDIDVQSVRRTSARIATYSYTMFCTFAQRAILENTHLKCQRLDIIYIINALVEAPLRSEDMFRKPDFAPSHVHYSFDS